MQYQIKKFDNSSLAFFSKIKQQGRVRNNCLLSFFGNNILSVKNPNCKINFLFKDKVRRIPRSSRHRHESAQRHRNNWITDSHMWREGLPTMAFFTSIDNKVDSK